ncbi:MAG: PA0069 family radical SAM protein [Saprospiraceae bacterium]|nr:PA0069 family radical SAM protein [Saprospiraceae bacterium]
MDDEKTVNHLKGRGARINPPSRFDTLIRDANDGHFANAEDQFAETIRTQYIETHPKTLVNKVDSPDIGMAWSMNPYQGCEHGCVYCYARNTHPYWGYSAGTDFESKILIKRNAPELLAKRLRSKSWQCAPIMLSGNTDCYQPVEKKLQLTRRLLEILLQFRHPVGLITKNSLILRDIDLLQELAQDDLVKVSISINSLNESLRQQLEPRTATYARRIDTISQLSAAGIPVNVMVAPVIPGLNDHEIMDVVKAVADAGARAAHHIVVRLNGDVRAIFEDWLEKHYPDRAAKVIRQISALHGGQTNDSRFGVRMKGEGRIAEIIADQMQLARRKFLADRHMPLFNTRLYEQFRNPQLSLFG